MSNMARFQLLRDALLCTLGLCMISKIVLTDDCYTECCQPPAVIGGVTYYPNKATYVIGEEVEYKCNRPSSYLFGSPKRRCLRDQKWDGEMPTCGRKEEIHYIYHDSAYHNTLFDERNSTCSSSGITDPWRVETKSSFFGDIAIKLVAKATGHISHKRKLQIEVKGRCRFVRNDYPHSTKLANGLYISEEFECNVESKTSEIKIRKISDWTNFDLCEVNVYTRPQIGCTPDYQILNGGLNSIRNTNEFQHGENVSVYCRKAYKLQGDDHLRCSYGKLIYEKEPKCIEVRCTSDFQIGNGGLNSTNEIQHGRNVSVYCRKGYRLEGDDRLHCSDGKLLYKNEPKCIPVMCKSNPPSIVNGNWPEWDSLRQFLYENRLTVTCNSGYFFTGKLNFTECQADGSWSITNFTCSQEHTETLEGFIIPILATTTGLVLLMIISILLWILCYKKRNCRKSQDENIGDVSPTSSVATLKEFLPPLPPMTTHPFYSGPKDICHGRDEEAIYNEPYDSIDRKETNTSQERTTNEPEYFCIEKENVMYGQFT